MESWLITKVLMHYLSPDQVSLVVAILTAVIILDRVLERLKIIKPNSTEELVIGFIVSGLKGIKGADYVSKVEGIAGAAGPSGLPAAGSRDAGQPRGEDRGGVQRIPGTLGGGAGAPGPAKGDGGTGACTGGQPSDSGGDDPEITVLREEGKI